MRIPRRAPQKARIEIIPMIDIIFFLLVFFMISTLSMTINRGLPVNLPKPPRRSKICAKSQHHRDPRGRAFPQPGTDCPGGPQPARQVWSGQNT